MPLTNGGIAALHVSPSVSVPQLCPPAFYEPPASVLEQPQPDEAFLTLPYTETWTGSNGSTWPLGWRVRVLSGATIDIQSNKGRVLTPAAGAYAPAGNEYLTGMPAVTDAEVTLTFTTPAALASETAYSTVTLRSSGATDATGYAPLDGYVLEIGASSSSVNSFVAINAGTTSGGAMPLLAGGGNSGITWAAATDYKLRFEVTGTTIRAKVWLASNAEPGTWLLSTTDSTFTGPGKLLMTHSSGSPAAARDLRFDDLTINSGLTIPVSAGPDVADVVDDVTLDITRAAGPDTADAVDAVTTSRDVSTAASDTAAAVDNVTADITRPVGPDTAGAVDAATAVQAAARAPADTAGATDATTATTSADRTLSDTAAATDASSTVTDTTRAASDTAGAVDSTALTVGLTVADTAGATDSAVAVFIITASASDTAGAVDAATATEDAQRAPADTGGATDAVTVVRTVALTVSDTADAVDAASTTSATTRTVGDTAGAVDAASGEMTVLTTVNVGPDLAAVTDSATAVEDAVRAPADTAAATDAVTWQLTRVVTITDQADAVDTLAGISARVLAVADSAGAVDAAINGYLRPITVSDAAAAVDAATAVIIPFLGNYRFAWGRLHSYAAHTNDARIGGVAGTFRTSHSTGHLED